MDIIEAELNLCYSGTINDSENVSNKCYLSKLALALTIPSFCSKFIDGNDRSPERERYVKWCDKYLKFPVLTSKECYAARCSLLHNGDDDLETQPVLDGEVKADEYKLSIPYSGDTLYLVKTGDTKNNEKSFCSNALINSLVFAYQQFKREYPDFVYPLQRNN